MLKAGDTYYVEALSEQTSGGDNLAVAWQGPALNQSVIQSSYLAPWGSLRAMTNGILCEYWTNFSAGGLEGVAGPRGFESALTVETARVISSRPGELPKPDRLALDQELPVENNYRWVQAEGSVKFAGADRDMTFLELSDGQALVQVRALHCSDEMSRRLRNVRVRIEGVCEGVSRQIGLNPTLAPGLIWASAEDSISFIETATPNAAAATNDSSAQSMTAANPAMQGFYGMRGVVTFNDRVVVLINWRIVKVAS